MKFKSIIFDEQELGRICCVRGSEEFFKLVGKYRNDRLIQLTESELEYFKDNAKTLYYYFYIQDTSNDNFNRKDIEIEIKDEEQEYLYTLSGFDYKYDQGTREFTKRLNIDKGKEVLIISQKDIIN